MKHTKHIDMPKAGDVWMSKGTVGTGRVKILSVTWQQVVHVYESDPHQERCWHTLRGFLDMFEPLKD